MQDNLVSLGFPKYGQGIIPGSRADDVFKELKVNIVELLEKRRKEMPAVIKAVWQAETTEEIPIVDFEEG